MRTSSKRSGASLQKNDLAALKKIISSGKNFLVVAHRDPEGDAIGSTLAVCSFLKGLGKRAVAYNMDGVPKNLHYLKGSQSVVREIPKAKIDVTFMLDCSEPQRVSPEFINMLPGLGKIVNIDHHITSKGAGGLNIIDPEASSTAEIIFRIFKAFGAKITKDVAESLYTAILTDTGSFRYSNSTPSAFMTASELVSMGADPWKSASKVYEEMPLERLNLVGAVLSTLEVLKEEKIASVTLTKEMIFRTGALPEYSDGLINFPRSIEGVEVAILFKEMQEDEYKVGFRSKGAVDVARVAAHFGGGGHRNASGCTVKGDLSAVKEKIYAKTKEAVFS